MTSESKSLNPSTACLDAFFSIRKGLQMNPVMHGTVRAEEFKSIHVKPQALNLKNPKSVNPKP